MSTSNKGPAHVRRGEAKGGKANKASKAASALLAVTLSAALAIFPLGPSAFAAGDTDTDTAAVSYAVAQGQDKAARSTSATDSRFSVRLGGIETISSKNYRWPNLTISTSVPYKKIYGVSVQLPGNIAGNDDVFIEEDGDFWVQDNTRHGFKTVYIDSGATASVWQEFLRSHLRIRLVNPDKIWNIRFFAEFSSSYIDRWVEYLPDNDHYYETYAFGVNNWVSWDAARKSALKESYMGMQGYLATVTTKKENELVNSLHRDCGNNGDRDCWLGASCDPRYIRSWSNASVDDKDFRWIDGPEAGVQIPSHVYPDAEGYSNWQGRAYGPEPNTGAGSEGSDYLVMRSWGEWSSTTKNWPVSIYIIEYGGISKTSQGDSHGAVSEVSFDPTGHTIFTTVNKSQIEFGDKLEIEERINDESVPVDMITHTFYVKDESQADGWREISESDGLDDSGQPVHPGSYKVVSSAVDDQGNPYKSGDATFTIVPKTINLSTIGSPAITKTYDGTSGFEGADTSGINGIDISGFLVEGTNVSLHIDPDLDGRFATSNACVTTVTLSGVSLEGEDAGDYRLAGPGDGTVSVKAEILPRNLVVNTTVNIAKGYAGRPLKDRDGNGLSLSTDLAVHDPASDVWPENEMAPNDAKVLADGTVTSGVLGNATIVPTDGEKALNPDEPERGTYVVEVNFSNVNPIGGSTPSNVIQVDENTYKVGNYLLTLNADPAIIKVTTRSAVDDLDGSETDPIFTPIDVTTDIRIDPSAAGTIGDDPYFEYDPDRPLNILDAIQVSPEGDDEWSGWMGGTGSSSDGSGNPDGPGTGNPGDPSVPSNPGGSGSGDGSGNGTGPGDTTPQLPDGVKVVVTDERGSQIDPTNVTDPGTYEVTVSVKDPDTDEFVVVKTLTFHVVDTSITDTDYIYKDVPKDHWGHDYIFDIGPKVINGAFNPSDVALGYMAGYAGTTNFGPHNDIIRGDAAIVVWRMAGCPDVEGDANDPDAPKLLSLANAYHTGFADCDANPTMYYNKAIAWCASNGIVEGYGDTGLYLPQNQITREEFASIIARYAAFKGKDTSSASADLTQYPDHDDVSDWAIANMHYVVSSGIMTGKGTDEGTAQGTHGILDPQAHVTRAEVAKMTYMEQPTRP